MQAVPPGMNPDGSPSNVANPPSLAPLTYGMGATMMVLATALVGIRILPVFKKEKLKIDDYFCLIALVLSCGYAVLIMTMASTATHAWDTRLSASTPSWLQRNAAQCMIYDPAMFFAKAAILTVYVRIFNSVNWLRYTCWVALIFLGLVYFSSIPVYAVFAFPHGDEKWDAGLAVKMEKIEVMAIVQAAITVACDVFLLTIPISPIMQLNLSSKKKIGVVAVFLTGSAAITSAVLGLYYRILNYRTGSGPDQDKSWVVAQTHLTALVELFITIMVSCAPGCVSSWRDAIKESAGVNSLRLFIYSARTSISRILHTSHKDTAPQQPKHSPSNSEINFAKYGFPAWEGEADEKSLRSMTDTSTTHYNEV